MEEKYVFDEKAQSAKPLDLCAQGIYFDYARFFEVENPWGIIPKKNPFQLPGVVNEPSKKKLPSLNRLVGQMEKNMVAFALTDFMQKNFKIFTEIDLSCYLNTGVSRTSMRVDPLNGFFNRKVVVEMEEIKPSKKDPSPSVEFESSGQNTETEELKLKFAPLNENASQWYENQDRTVIHYVVIKTGVEPKNREKILRGFHGLQNVCVLRQQVYDAKGAKRALGIAAFCHTKYFHYKTYAQNHCKSDFESSQIRDLSVDVFRGGAVGKVLEDLINPLKALDETPEKKIKKVLFPYPLSTGVVEAKKNWIRTIPESTNNDTANFTHPVAKEWIARDLYYTLTCGIGTHFMCMMTMSREKKTKFLESYFKDFYERKIDLTSMNLQQIHEAIKNFCIKKKLIRNPPPDIIDRVKTHPYVEATNIMYHISHNRYETNFTFEAWKSNLIRYISEYTKKLKSQ